MNFAEWACIACGIPATGRARWDDDSGAYAEAFHCATHGLIARRAVGLPDA